MIKYILKNKSSFIITLFLLISSLKCRGYVCTPPPPVDRQPGLLITIKTHNGKVEFTGTTPQSMQCMTIYSTT